MTARPVETTELHTRLPKCAIEVEDGRAYWAHVDGPHEGTPEHAFSLDWFGSRSLPCVQVPLTGFRARFDIVPPALRALAPRRGMDPDIRRNVGNQRRIKRVPPMPFVQAVGAWRPDEEAESKR